MSGSYEYSGGRIIYSNRIFGDYGVDGRRTLEDRLREHGFPEKAQVRAGVLEGVGVVDIYAHEEDLDSFLVMLALFGRKYPIWVDGFGPMVEFVERFVKYEK